VRATPGVPERRDRAAHRRKLARTCENPSVGSVTFSAGTEGLRNEDLAKSDAGEQIMARASRSERYLESDDEA